MHAGTLITLLHHKRRYFAAAATFVDRHSFLKRASGGSWLRVEAAVKYSFGKPLWLCTDQNSASLVFSTGKLPAQPWHHVFLQPAAPATCPGFWWRRTVCLEQGGWNGTNLNGKVHTVTNIWEGESSCRMWTCVMWFESQMKEIKLELKPPAPGRNHARRSGGKISELGHFELQLRQPEIIPTHQLQNSTTQTCASEERCGFFLGLLIVSRKALKGSTAAR